MSRHQIAFRLVSTLIQGEHLHMTFRSYIIGLVIFTLALLGLSACQSSDMVEVNSQEPVQIFLVRHAEKMKDRQDPDLTEAGHARAESLARILADANITDIHSSDYKRTLQTADPLAKALGIDIALYDPRDLPKMADYLKNTRGIHLVVGHSNTTPPLTELLGGEPHTPIVEETEYDRLYMVSMAEDGSVTSTLLRY